MKRTPTPVVYRVTPVDTTRFADDLAAWFQRQPSVGSSAWFLAHADDGVIWGQIRDERLVVSHDAFPTVSPSLRAITLQQARLFGQEAEVRLWREDDSFRACRIQDHAGEEAQALDEEHLLWGTQAEDVRDGFTLVADGRQGLRHAVPLVIPATAFTPKSRRHPLRLGLRHYLTCDADGQAHITLSRLVSLGLAAQKGGE